MYGKCRAPDAAESIFRSGSPLDAASWNTMIVMYVKLGRLESARRLFDEMPDRDCVSFTTMIMGLGQRDEPAQALRVFQEMLSADIRPNEVTLSSVTSACSHLHSIVTGRAVHGLAIKSGLEDFLLVSTNLVHFYALSSSIKESETVFTSMPERNIVTWNTMLNGYAKAEALLMYREMAKTVVVDGRPNEVMIVDLISSCARLSAFNEGRQFHAVILKSGLDSYAFVQATIVHFYAECGYIELASSQFWSGDMGNVSSWNALIGGFIHNNMLETARSLFDEMPDRDVVSWSTMIAGYSKKGSPSAALDLFHGMQAQGIQPNEITLLSVLSAISASGTLEQGRRVHNYIRHHSIWLTDNLRAALIDMYSKCGSIGEALLLFNQTRDSAANISPWNAVICGLAMHGHAEMSLRIFSELENTKIKPNSITFIGVLSACCHKGLVAEGKHYFEQMKNAYKIEPTIKHYGCMVDLLGRAGLLEEAHQLVVAMPMEPDVVIWGTMLAASRTHGNVEIGEKAVRGLTSLEPNHGASKVLLSNIYADAGRWEDVLLVRQAMQARGLKKLPGCSGVV
ncbi:unnamed protein product [Spirodela intermedia]|uniref:Uncharacterized protein n=1 Tax=Spirodela intermedia TaxID=51605 RepID=A0A7I8I8W7_SPIIN|nr:unnamed protein product [Spirodela intermedia]CAA6654116.1 unnamed protein product [Spirodela intermedia]